MKPASYLGPTRTPLNPCGPKSARISPILTTGRRAWEEVFDWLSANKERFLNSGIESRLQKAPLGEWERGSSHIPQCIKIIPTELDTILKDLGHQPTGIRRNWRDKGWIKTRKQSTSHPTSITDYIDKERMKLVVFTEKAFRDLLDEKADNVIEFPAPRQAKKKDAEAPASKAPPLDFFQKRDEWRCEKCKLFSESCCKSAELLNPQHLNHLDECPEYVAYRTFCEIEGKLPSRPYAPGEFARRLKELAPMYEAV